VLLLSKIIDYLGCGNLEKPSTRPDGAIFVVYKFSDICEKIIPKGALRPPTFQPPAAETFFQNYPLQGVKLLDFNDFCKIADFMKNKSHLTSEGLEQIRHIKSGMNRGRVYSVALRGSDASSALRARDARLKIKNLQIDSLIV
jgi:hypothetical protein